jgi:Trk K+ transport system NAD-binding subunit
VPPDGDFALRADDVLVMIGLQTDLAEVASEFTQARNIKSA